MLAGSERHKVNFGTCEITRRLPIAPSHHRASSKLQQGAEKQKQLLGQYPIIAAGRSWCSPTLTQAWTRCGNASESTMFPLDYRVSPADKSNMARYLLRGFSKCFSEAA
jgi:hypothetical protein